MSTADILFRITDLVQNPDGSTVSADEVRSWMAHPQFDVQGAAYQLLRKHGNSAIIRPPLPEGEQFAFFKNYLERCIHEDVEGDWSYSSYSACWEIAAWMASLFEDAAARSAELDDLRGWLASLYANGSPSERDALLNGTLEHLFERPEIREHFRSWQKDPTLSQVFADASFWSEEGGDSPLVGTRKAPKETK